MTAAASTICDDAPKQACQRLKKEQQLWLDNWKLGLQQPCVLVIDYSIEKLNDSSRSWKNIQCVRFIVPPPTAEIPCPL